MYKSASSRPIDCPAADVNESQDILRLFPHGSSQVTATAHPGVPKEQLKGQVVQLTPPDCGTGV